MANRRKWKKTVFYCRADLFGKFEVAIEDETKVFCACVNVSGEGAQGIGGRGGVVTKNNDFCFIVV